MNQTHFVQYTAPGRAPTIQHYVPPPPVAHSLPVLQHQQQHYQQHAQQQAQQQQHRQTPTQHSPSQAQAHATQSQSPPQSQLQTTTISPNATYKHKKTSSPSQSGPLVARGDWTKNLVHLAKTAELKQHSLSLQLHAAHILSAHAQLEAKNKEIDNVKEEKKKLEEERMKLLSALREVNENRDKTDLKETTLMDECTNIQSRIRELSEGEFAQVKQEVDALRAELGQSPTPALEIIIRDKNISFANDKRTDNSYIARAVATPPTSTTSAGTKRTKNEAEPVAEVVKRPRGRPKGSKNKSKHT